MFGDLMIGCHEVSELISPDGPDRPAVDRALGDGPSEVDGAKLGPRSRHRPDDSNRPHRTSFLAIRRTDPWPAGSASRTCRSHAARASLSRSPIEPGLVFRRRRLRAVDGPDEDAAVLDRLEGVGEL